MSGPTRWTGSHNVVVLRAAYATLAINVRVRYGQPLTTVGCDRHFGHDAWLSAL